jgi:tape measure domain-containing protein
MATDLERLVVRLEADINKFTKSMEKASADGARATKKIEDDFARLNPKLKSLLNESTAIVSSSFSKFAAVAAGALSAKALLDYADAWQKAANKIAAAGEDASRVGPRLSQLTDIALRSRTGLSDTIDLYTSLKRSTEELQPSQAQLTKATENVNKAFVVGGQGAAAQAAGIQQLGQALQSGALQGDELRSIRENAPLIAKAIADTIGVPIGKLKELGAEGKITSDIVLKALLNMGKGVEAQFARTTPTVEQSFASLRTNVTRFIGELDQQTGASSKFAGRIQQLSNAIASVGPAAATTAIAILESFGGAQAWFNPAIAGATVAGTAIALFGDTIRPVAGEFATLTDYAVAAFRIAKEAGGEAWASITKAAQIAADALNAVFSGLPASSGDALGQVLQAVKTVVNAIIGTFVAAGGAVAATWSGMTAGLAEQMVNAMNAAIAAVESAIQKIVGALNSVTSAIPGGIIPQITAPDLGRISNTFAGAGAAAGQAFRDSFGALTRDYVGDTIASVDAVLARIQARANAIAADRAQRSFKAGEAASYNTLNDGDPNKGLKPPPKNNNAGGGGGGGGSDAGKENEFQRELANIEKRILAYERERAALGLSTFEAAKAEAAFKLMDAAKSAGIPINEDLKARIDSVSSALAAAKVATDQAKESQQAFNDLARFAGSALSSFFSDIVSGGENAQKALSNLVKKLAEAALQATLLGEGPLAKLFGTKGTDGNVGGLLGGISTLLFGRSSGGPVSSGQPYRVGENGPELFVPGQNGSIVSAGRTGGFGGGTVTVYIQSDGTLPAMIQTVARGVAVQVTQQGIAANNSRIPAMLAQQESR